MAMITSQVKLGVTSEDVGTVQTLLKAKGLYLGKPDNKCGPKTVAAIKEFQAKMTYFDGKVPDGAVSPNGPTWQALNSTVGTGLKMSPLVRGLVRQIESRPDVLAARAAVVAGGWALKTVNALRGGKVNVDKFMAGYKKRHGEFKNAKTGEKVAWPPLGPQSEANLRALIEALVEHYPSDIPKIAYSLATAKHEAYNWQKPEFFCPEGEIGGAAWCEQYDPILANTPSLRARAVKNGNTVQGDGYKYRGRGLVQLTWKNNYRKMGPVIGLDLVNNPDLASDLKNAITIMIIGMERGLFTTVKLGSYVNSKNKNYVGARAVINDPNDKPHAIAGYAKIFEEILEASK
jgi:hypothetical protein